jgi:predicted DNA-binding protein
MTTSISLPDELYERIKKDAARSERSFANMILLLTKIGLEQIDRDERDLALIRSGSSQVDMDALRGAVQ